MVMGTPKKGVKDRDDYRVKWESVHCWKCVGSGLMGKISAIGVKSVKMCKHCRGVGRLRVEVGSYAWKKGREVSGIGLGKRIRVRD